MFTIGDLSEKTGVSTEAIRYYERIGLIPEPQRADNGYRLYIDHFRQFHRRYPSLSLSAVRLAHTAQHDSLATSLVKESAASFNPSTCVRYGNRVSVRSSSLRPNLTASVAV